MNCMHWCTRKENLFNSVESSYKWHKWNQRRNSLPFHHSPESHHANENVMMTCVLSSSTSSIPDSAWTHQTGILRDQSTSEGLKHVTAIKPLQKDVEIYIYIYFCFICVFILSCYINILSYIIFYLYDYVHLLIMMHKGCFPKPWTKLNRLSSLANQVLLTKLAFLCQ